MSDPLTQWVFQLRARAQDRRAELERRLDAEIHELERRRSLLVDLDELARRSAALEAQRSTLERECRELREQLGARRREQAELALAASARELETLERLVAEHEYEGHLEHIAAAQACFAEDDLQAMSPALLEARLAALSEGLARARAWIERKLAEAHEERSALPDVAAEEQSVRAVLELLERRAAAAEDALRVRHRIADAAIDALLSLSGGDARRLAVGRLRPTLAIAERERSWNLPVDILNLRGERSR